MKFISTNERSWTWRSITNFCYKVRTDQVVMTKEKQLDMLGDHKKTMGYHHDTVVKKAETVCRRLN